MDIECIVTANFEPESTAGWLLGKSGKQLYISIQTLQVGKNFGVGQARNCHWNFVVIGETKPIAGLLLGKSGK
jgi:hypothetical protein